MKTILYLNVVFTYNHLQVTRRNLVEVLTTKKTKTRNEQFIVPYKYGEVSYDSPFCVYTILIRVSSFTNGLLSLLL